MGHCIQDLSKAVSCDREYTHLSLAVLGVQPRPRPQEQPGYGRMGVVGGQVQGGREGHVGLR